MSEKKTNNNLAWKQHYVMFHSNIQRFYRSTNQFSGICDDQDEVHECLSLCNKTQVDSGSIKANLRMWKYFK